MVIVKLRGRLGNQMFQYAFGRCLAERWGSQLLLDTSNLHSTGWQSPRPYRLDIFNLHPNISATGDFATTSGVVLHIEQRKRGFHPTPHHISSSIDVITRGWWQNENYFFDIKDMIRNEFRFKEDIHTPEDMITLNRIRSTNSVCVHIRRTDYVNSKNVMRFIGTEYYSSAFHSMAERINHPHFYIFSDDIEWCMQNLKCPGSHTFITRRVSAEESFAVDLNLMTKCRHFITANSTFSWWAAWLGDAPYKIVIAPKLWFGDEHSSQHILPEDWVAI